MEVKYARNNEFHTQYFLPNGSIFFHSKPTVSVLLRMQPPAKKNQMK